MKLVILARDGVINRVLPQRVRSIEDWQPLPGSLEAMSRLYREGYKLIVIAHQPGVAAGEYSMETLGRIHNRMLEAVRHKGGEIDAIFICPHAEDAGCRCRRPNPGLIEDVADRLKINLSGVPVIGADADDLAAARAAGATPVLVGDPAPPAGVRAYPDLAAFADALLAGERRTA